jgi:DNA end-binding protein Ku
MKAVWEGSIAFGLVDIPIKIYSATEPRTVTFRLLCEKCKSPIQYKRFCEGCKKEVPWNEVVYGFEISKGKYKIISREQLSKLKPGKSDTAEVISFIDISSIDPVYFQKSYYALPAKNKEKPFFLFMEALRSNAKVAITRITLKNKEYITMIRPYRNVLMMTTLLYSEEIRKLEKFEELNERPKVSSEELKLAGKIIERYSMRDLDITKYHDEFALKLREFLEGKKQKIEVKKNPKPEKLIEALRLSVKK